MPEAKATNPMATAALRSIDPGRTEPDSTREVIAALLKDLRQAAKIWKAAPRDDHGAHTPAGDEDATGWAQHHAALLQILAFGQFVRRMADCSVLSPHEAWEITRPLHEFGSQAYSLRDGKVGPLLTPPPAKPKGGKALTLAEWDQRAIVAGVIDALQECGGMDRRQAARAVADRLAKVGRPLKIQSGQLRKDRVPNSEDLALRWHKSALSFIKAHPDAYPTETYASTLERARMMKQTHDEVVARYSVGMNRLAAAGDVPSWLSGLLETLQRQDMMFRIIGDTMLSAIA